MISYGVPYKGSKNTIAERLLEHIPPATHLYDVFAGGCAMSHAAMLSRRYGHVHANDIPGLGIRLFDLARRGELGDVGSWWVGREQYSELLNIDPYVSHCWSFSSKPSSYMFGKESEPYEYAAWAAVAKGDFAPLRGLFPELAEKGEEALSRVEGLLNRYKAWKPVVSGHLRSIGLDPNENFSHRPFVERRLFIMGRIGPIINAARLLSIRESLRECRTAFTSSSVDYRDCPVTADGVIYADPPYKGTTFCSNLTKGFDSESFYDWAERQGCLVVISEYDMPRDRFSVVYEVGKANFGKGGNAKSVTERLFVPKGQVAMYREMMGGLILN